MPCRSKTAADEMGSDLVPPEDISSETVKDAKLGPLVLPTNFGRRTGDLDEMLKERRIRALVVINPIGFFYSHGKPKGMTYEMVEQLQTYLNKKLKTGTFDVKVTFIPLRPDELGPALREGIGDVIAQGVVITPGRQRNFAFTTPKSSWLKSGPQIAEPSGVRNPLNGLGISAQVIVDRHPL
jgi:hypothetical protein